jgi:hypothetical protein
MRYMENEPCITNGFSCTLHVRPGYFPGGKFLELAPSRSLGLTYEVHEKPPYKAIFTEDSSLLPLWQALGTDPR